MTEEATTTTTEQANPESGGAVEQETSTAPTETSEAVETETTSESQEVNNDIKEETQKKTEPITYTDFTVPDGIEIDKESMEAFKQIGSELGIKQEDAQKLLDLQTKLAQKQQSDFEAAMAKQAEDWQNEVLAIDTFKGDEGAKNILLES